MKNTSVIQVDGKRKRIAVRNECASGPVRWNISSCADGSAVKSGTSSGDEIVIDCSDLSPWSPESPHLYELVFEDKEPFRFGLLGLEVTQDHIYVNDNPYYIRGYIRGLKAHEHDNFTFENIRDFHEKHIRMAKAYGFNYVRWHSAIPDEDFLNLADELGLICHIEFSFEAIWGKDEDGGNLLVGVKFDADDIRDTILRLSRHPSAAVYCLGNEIHNSAGSPEVLRMVDLVRTLEPSKILMDSCGWGEYDRDTTDFHCQHMGYFFPFGPHHDMFDVLDCFSLNGSVRGPLHEEGTGSFVEAINVDRPVTAHEVLHYISWPDVDKLDRDFSSKETNALDKPKPWWVDEVRKLEKTKGIEGERKKRVVEASRRFHFACAKHAIEQIRKSPFLQGFMMLQLADTHHYENANGLLDCFDNPKFITPDAFKQINSEVVLLLDLRERCFRSGEEHEFSFFISNYAPVGSVSYGDMEIVLKEDDKALQSITCQGLSFKRRGSYMIGQYKIVLPQVSEPAKLTIEARLSSDGEDLRNSWDIWVFPAVESASVDGTTVTSHIDEEMLERVACGDRVLCLYNPLVSEAEPGSLHFPYVKDHFKPVIWDRGHQMGAIIRDHKALGGFSHEGWMDFQFARLVEGAVKVSLDDFPVEIDPIVEGIDRPVRDRMSIIMGKVTGFDPAYYMRKFGYLFELQIGDGRLMVCTFDFSKRAVESEYLLSALLEYLKQPSEDAVEISIEQLTAFLRSCGGRSMEPPMNAYWEGDDLPVETKLFWEEIGADITAL